jgi:competence protein ComGA
VQDICLIPKKENFVLSFRTADKIVEEEILEANFAEGVMTHIKFLSGMNVGEHRRSQLGAYTLPLDKGEVRLRISTVGNFEQKESMVIRILANSNNQHRLDYFVPEHLIELQNAMKKRGLFLFSGPVGSGKTSLMYEMVKHFEGVKSIISIEDPVEIVDENILQLQVNEKIGNTYDSLVKLSLRHRPDVLIVGEIRDALTARAVVRAALTGHCVLSTVHAKSARGVKARMMELGVSENEWNEMLNGVSFTRVLQDKNGSLKGLFSLATFDSEKGGKLVEQISYQNELERLFNEGEITFATYQKEVDC